MNERDRRKSGDFFRQAVIDNIKKLGLGAVKVMAEDLRRSGYYQKAELIDSLVKER